MQYQGSAFNDIFEKGKCSGVISLTTSSIIFTAKTGDVATLPIHGLLIENGGASNRLIYFSHPSFPHWTIFTSDTSILKDPSLQGSKSVNQSLSEMKRRRVTAISIVIFMMLSVVGVFAFLYSEYGRIIEYGVSKVPPYIEKRGGTYLNKLYQSQCIIIADSTLNLEMNKITNRILSVVDTNFKFDFYIVKDTNLNAFATPGGFVYVNSGLIQNSTSSEMLAGVLAHEISHVTQRHHVRNIISSQGLVYIVSLLLGENEDIQSVIAKSGVNLGILKFSRDFEREADSVAYQYMVESQINPNGLRDVFILFKENAQKLGSLNATFLSTHPQSEDRIKNIERMIHGNNEKYNELKVNIDLMKSIVDSLEHDL